MATVTIEIDTGKELAAIDALTQATQALAEATVAETQALGAATASTTSLAAAVDALTAVIEAMPPPGSGGSGSGGTVPSVPDTQPIWTMGDATQTPNGHGTDFSFGNPALPDEIVIAVNSSNHTDNPLASLAYFCGTNFEKQLGDAMQPTSRNASTPGDRFIFHGNYQNGVKVGIGTGIPVYLNKDPSFNGAWTIFVTVNGFPYETTGNFDGTPKTTTGPIFNSKDANEVWVPSGTAAAGGGTGGTTPPSTNPPGWGFSDPVYNGVEDTITITVDGVARTGKFSALAAAFVAGNEVHVPAGKFIATGSVPAIKLIGATHADGTPASEFSCMGIQPAGKKAVINAALGHVAIENMILSDAAISAANGENAAGVRTNHDATGANISSVTLANCVLKNNQNGALGPDVSFVPGPNGEMSEVFGNGRWIAKPGQQHGVYCNGGVMSLDHVFFHDNSMRGHEVKGRCDEVHLKTLKVVTSQGSSDSGDFLDVPEGGLVVGDDVDVTTGVGSDRKLWTYAAENANRAARGKSISISNFRVHDMASAFAPEMRNGGKIPDATVVLGVGCVYDDEKPAASGYATGAITGDWIKAV